MLKNINVLVIEKEFLIALDIQRMLETLDAGEIVFARSFEEAGELEHHWPRIGLAIVEVTLEPQIAYALVERLMASGIAVVLSSADIAFMNDTNRVLALPLVGKPMAENELVQAIGRALAVSS